MHIEVETIPHKSQRYPTAGDWVFDGEDLKVLVSEMWDWREEALLAIHEVLEALICRSHGIGQELVDKFDMKFEEDRKDGDLSEPGDSIKAPYYPQHQFASGIERLLAKELGVDWKKYEEHLDQLETL